MGNAGKDDGCNATTRSPVNHRQLENQVQYELSNLGARNAQHDFEHLCRHVARLRICSNILPATGPVSAGGDQGRDFETYRTHLNSEFGSSAFLALASSKHIAFACSLQAKKVPTKIKSDVTKICTEGSIVQEVHFFTNQNIPSGKRHELQEWARKEYRVDLEIHDLQGLSSHLCNEDTFWIASEYLNLPASLFPLSQVEGWYEMLKDCYTRKTSLTFNYAEFHEIQRSIRHATFEVKVDVSFWLSRLYAYPSIDEQTKLARMVCYEICAATLRGLGNLENCGKLITAYFRQLSLCAISELENVQILLSYVVGAKARGIATIEIETLRSWRQELQSIIEAKLKEDLATHNIADLLQTAGSLSMLDSDLNPDLSLKTTLGYWWRLVEIVPRLPLFPLERFSNHLLECQKWVGTNTELEKLSKQVDELVAERASNASIAEKSKNRALNYYENGLLIEAIQQLHRAKDHWLNHESITGAVLSLKLLAEWYAELGLSYAAKYYSMTAFSIAYSSKNRSVHRQLSSIAAQLANLEYQAGCWHSSLVRARLFYLVYSNFESDPAEQFLFDEASQSVSANLGLLDYSSQRLAPESYPELSQIVAAVGLASSDIISLRGLIESIWDSQSNDEIVAACRRDLADRPYADGGTNRIIRWVQSGISFEITFLNSFATALAAEQLAAGFQILLADFGNEDLYVLPGSVEIQFTLTATRKATSCRSVNDNNRSHFEILFLEGQTDEQVDKDILACLVTVLNTLSVLPFDRLQRFLQSRFEEGLSKKLFGGGTYACQMSNSMTEREYDIPIRLQRGPLISAENFQVRIHPLLAWNSTVVREYNQGESLTAVKRRYDRISQVLRLTLPRLSKSSVFLEVVNELKRRGWLDWHILMGLANLVVNYKVAQEIGREARSDPQEIQDVTMKYFNREEDDGDPIIPESELTVDAIEMHITTTSFATLKNLGFEIKSTAPNFPGTMQFLRSKCGFNDDIPHPKLW